MYTLLVYLIIYQSQITMYITLIAPIAGMGMITNIGSPHDRLGAHDWSIRVSDIVIALPSLRPLVVTHLLIALADCDQVKNASDK